MDELLAPLQDAFEGQIVRVSCHLAQSAQLSSAQLNQLCYASFVHLPAQPAHRIAASLTTTGLPRPTSSRNSQHCITSYFRRTLRSPAHSALPIQPYLPIIDYSRRITSHFTYSYLYLLILPFLPIQAISFVVGYMYKDIHLTLWIGLGGTIFTGLAVIPAWPWFNRNPEVWFASAKGNKGGPRVLVDGVSVH